MKKLFAYSFLTTTLFFGGYSAKADWDYWEIISTGNSGEFDIFTVDIDTNEKTLRTTKQTDIGFTPGSVYVDGFNNLVIPSGSKIHKYNLDSNEWTDISGFTGHVYLKNPLNELSNDVIKLKKGETEFNIDREGIAIGTNDLIKKSSNTISIGDSLNILEDSRKLLMNGNTIFKRNDDGTIQIGTDTNDIDITSQGISVGGRPLITRRANGKIHIGKNSLITTEEEETLSDGRKVQPLYAEDGDTNRIPINIDGSKLLIDGVEVKAGNHEQITTNKNNISTNKANIKNLGEGVAGSTALTAALSALPQTSKESKLSCGVGSGAYSNRYAVGFGCASKVNERVDVNAGGSYVFGGSKSYGGGTLDSGVVKAGFVFKLGELKKNTQISMKEKEKMEEKIYSLEEKNEKIISQNKALLSRLERLEKIALIGTKSKDLAVYKLK